MKKALILIVFAAAGVMISPAQKMVGDFNLISTRNYDPADPGVLLKTRATQTKRQIKKAMYSSLEEAVNATIGDVPGGEYMMNAQIYAYGGRYAAIGDIWGKPNGDIRGFRTGDAVIWKKPGMPKPYNATIESFISRTEVYIAVEGMQGLKKAKIDSITKK